VSDDDDDDSIDLLKRHVADLQDYIKCKRRARRMSREINRRNYAEILVRIVCNRNLFAVARFNVTVTLENQILTVVCCASHG